MNTFYRVYYWQYDKWVKYPTECCGQTEALLKASILKDCGYKTFIEEV